MEFWLTSHFLYNLVLLIKLLKFLHKILFFYKKGDMIIEIVSK